MKTRQSVLVVLMSLLSLILLGGCAQPNKQLYYGTWTNEHGHFQKTVRTSDGVVKDYYLLSDTTPVQEVKEQIISCWSDSEGNVWFKTEATITAGPNKNTMPKVQTLQKISKSGTFLEMMWSGVMDFNPKSFPTKIDTTDPYRYWTFNRAAK